MMHDKKPLFFLCAIHRLAIHLPKLVQRQRGVTLNTFNLLSTSCRARIAERYPQSNALCNASQIGSFTAVQKPPATVQLPFSCRIGQSFRLPFILKLLSAAIRPAQFPCQKDICTPFSLPRIVNRSRTTESGGRRRQQRSEFQWLPFPTCYRAVP